jgi:hypothetical protein
MVRVFAAFIATEKAAVKTAGKTTAATKAKADLKACMDQVKACKAGAKKSKCPFATIDHYRARSITPRLTPNCFAICLADIREAAIARALSRSKIRFGRQSGSFEKGWPF